MSKNTLTSNKNLGSTPQSKLTKQAETNKSRQKIDVKKDKTQENEFMGEGSTNKQENKPMTVRNSSKPELKNTSSKIPGKENKNS